MKFISKNSNLRVILTPSIQAEPITGRPAVRGLFVKFEDGVANIVDDEIIDRMLKHPAFNVDFICADEGTKDPFIRRSVEPEHNVVNIEYGHVGKNINPATPITMMTPEMKRAVSDMAMNIAQKMTEEALKELTPKLTAQIISNLKGATEPVAENTVAEDNEQSAPKKRGRPPKTEN